MHLANENWPRELYRKPERVSFTQDRVEALAIAVTVALLIFALVVGTLR